MTIGNPEGKDGALEARPRVQRWRLLVALGATLVALPLLAIDQVSSAQGSDSPTVEVFGVTATRRDAGFAVLATRATGWAEERETRRQQDVAEATELAAVAAAIEAENAAEAERLAEAQRIAAAQAAETARVEEANRKAAAARKAADEAAARKKAAATTTTAKPPPAAPATTVEPRSGEPTPDQWLGLRQCESSNNYKAVSAGGRFRGAYQFSQATWNWVAANVAPDLVGVDPAQAAPGHQDNMALSLYRLRGASQWPICSSTLR